MILPASGRSVIQVFAKPVADLQLGKGKLGLHSVNRDLTNVILNILGPVWDRMLWHMDAINVPPSLLSPQCIISRIVRIEGAPNCYRSIIDFYRAKLYLLLRDLADRVYHTVLDR